MAGKRKRTKKREATAARKRRRLKPRPAPETEASLAAPTLLLNLHEMVIAVRADVKMLLNDRAEARTEHRQMAERLGDVDNRLGQVEATLVKIEPVVWNHETDKQRGIGGRTMLKQVVTRGRVVMVLGWSATATVAGWFGHAIATAPVSKIP